jgi:hypothetical protein
MDLPMSGCPASHTSRYATDEWHASELASHYRARPSGAWVVRRTSGGNAIDRDMRQHGKAVPYQRAVSAYPGRISEGGHGLAMTSYRNTPAIEAPGLWKSFGDKIVLDGIELNVAEGTIFSLLGPNGAGKTTTVHILSTLISFDAGEVRVAGHDLRTEPDSVRAAIGVTGQFSAVDNLLTGEENLILRSESPGPGRGAVARGRAAGAVRPDRGGEEAGIDVLGRHAAAARPCYDPGRQLADHLPGRADHRP